MIQKCFQLYKKIENFWFTFDEKIRYLLVGGFNTVFAYLLYCFFFLIMTPIAYADQYALVLQNIVSINLSVFTMRYYVFRSHGNIKKEYLKAVHVYIVMLCLNSVALSLIQRILPFDETIKPMIAQAIWIVFATVIVYFLHKYFSFRKASI